MSERPLDTGTDDLLGRIDGHVAVLTFNRPEARNALSPGVYDGFDRALPVVAADPEVRVLMITGAGGAFCAGGDVKGMANRNAAATDGSAPPAPSVEEKVADLRRRQRGVSLALHSLPKPVVAALPGAAAGAGMSIAMAADLRVAAERALIVTAFTTIGASGDFGGSWFLTRLLGEAKAKELYFRSPRLSASEAQELGLVNQVFADDDFEALALGYCHELAARPPIALRYVKENINRASEVDLATALDAEAAAMVRTMSTEDHAEAAAAFVAKRSPTFRGH
ncbi:MAG: enoyl-CoA hydratase-related protein [Actinomycetota bacterium]